jgi:hypothetical protein
LIDRLRINPGCKRGINLAILFACKQAPTVRIGADCKISWLQATPLYFVISARTEMTGIKLGFADLPPIIRRLQ